jgi:ABC-2 type transport system ATP-binding protein
MAEPAAAAAAVATAVSRSDFAAISADRVTKRYRGRAALERASFSVAPGELFALLGPNGAGKTTTVELLLGLRRPDEGTVRVLGLDPVADARRLHPRIGVLLQDGAIPSGMKVAEAVRLHAAFSADPADPDELIERLDLGRSAATPYRRLSGGQRQRVQLALALVGRPEVLFLDEPTAGLDPAARQTTWELVRELAADGATVLLTTQLIEEAERVADRVAIVDRGRLVAAGSPGELVASAAGTAVVVRTSDPVDAERLERAVGARVQAGEPDGPGREYRVLADPSPRLVAAVAAALAEQDVLAHELRVGGGSLEQVFLDLTGGTGVPSEEVA